MGAIVISRYGENALDVISRVQAKIEELKVGLPPGVEIIPTYDRSSLIERAIETLKHSLTEEAITVSLVIVLNSSSWLFMMRSLARGRHCSGSRRQP